MMLAVVEELVEDGVGEGGVSDGSVPVVDGYLTSASTDFSSACGGGRCRDMGGMGR